jgi:menaquinone-dependent protoporphyrinogen IX oxidase
LVKVLGEGTQMVKIAIVYATTTGSTAEIVEKMKMYYKDRNVDATIIKASDTIVKLDEFKMVLIGSGIYGNKVHENVKTFIDKNREQLNKRNVAVFAVCGMMCSGDEKKKNKANAFADVVACGLSPVSKSVFATRLPDRGWFNNLMLKILWNAVPGDHRDLDKIKSWTLSILNST